MPGNDFGQTWVKSKVVHFMAIYWAVIIVLVHVGKFLEANGEALVTAVLTILFGLVLFGSGVLAIYLYRRGRRW